MSNFMRNIFFQVVIKLKLLLHTYTLR